MDKGTIKPLGENVLIKATKENVKTKTGLVIPETAAGERPQQGKVMAIGDSPKIKVKKNQTVIFAKYSGSEISVGNEEYLILKNEDILAIIE